MKKSSRSFLPAWLVLLFVTWLVVYLYTFSEWLFFVTKPSFMSGMSVWSQLKIFLISALGLSFFPTLAIVLLGSLDRLIHREVISRVLLALGVLIPTLFVSAAALLLVDNFTYTVLGFGIVSTERISRALYALLYIVFCIFAYGRIRSHILFRNRKKHPVRRESFIALSGLLLLSLTVSLFYMFTGREGVASDVSPGSKEKDLPNIILLGSDGVAATHLSVYGYGRNTTPNISSMGHKALIAENAFPNGGTTAGSIASILTGKLPIETRVLYHPDILRGEDSYQHLPGILKRLGYHTVDLSVPYYGDALSLNVQGGFDQINDRSGGDNPVLKVSRILGGGDSAYFVDTMLQRISERLLHIFFLKPMINSFEKVVEPTDRGDEQYRFNRLIATLQEANGPVFVHVHMLGTHGPRFEIRQRVFSAGQTQTSDWMTDYYDDAILSFDQYVGELFRYLSDSGQLGHTLILIYSDHGMQWNMHQRVPLIFWFPDEKYAGKIHASAQNIDISPTVLDYLDVPIPAWMAGQSLLREDLETPDHIFSASVDTDLVTVAKDGIWSVQMERTWPPFYQVGYVDLVACNQWYELYLPSPRLQYGDITDYKGPCDASTLPTPEQAIQILLDHLFQNGFDVSSFPKSVPMHQAQ